MELNKHQLSKYSLEQLKKVKNQLESMITMPLMNIYNLNTEQLKGLKQVIEDEIARRKSVEDGYDTVIDRYIKLKV